MFCPNCGSQNADNVVFCANCGARLGAEQPVAGQPVAGQPIYQPPQSYAYQTPMQPASVPGKGLGITGMVLGIISLVLFCILYISIPCSIVGAILSGVALKKAKDAGMKNGMAVAGLVCSLIALGICVISWVLAAAAVAEIGTALDTMF